jgi:hypothetical protein
LGVFRNARFIHGESYQAPAVYFPPEPGLHCPIAKQLGRQDLHGHGGAIINDTFGFRCDPAGFTCRERFDPLSVWKIFYTRDWLAVVFLP